MEWAGVEENEDWDNDDVWLDGVKLGDPSCSGSLGGKSGSLRKPGEVEWVVDVCVGGVRLPGEKLDGVVCAVGEGNSVTIGDGAEESPRNGEF